MLVKLQVHHFSATLRFQDHGGPNFPATLPFSFPACNRPRLFTVASAHRNHQENRQNTDTSTSPAPSNDEASVSRKHNSKSTSMLLHFLSFDQTSDSETPPMAEREVSYAEEEEEDKMRLLEMSLIRRRTPQFPGSIYVQSPSDPNVNSSLPPIKTLFDDQIGIVAAVDDEEMLIKALEIRRRVTTEIFMEAMRKGKFGITYSRNLVSKLSDFIDFVMIQAASMKQMPEFSHSSFNSRARAFIDDSNVVPMIRWLKHNSLSFPQIGNLICKSRRDVTYIRRFAEWLKSVNVKGRFIGVAMLRSGKNVFSRSFDDLDENIEYLEKNGVRRDWIGFVISRCPEILSFSMEELKMRVEFYLNLGMNENDFGTMVFDYPKVLGYLSMEEMNQKVAYLKEFGLSNEDVGRVIALKPHLMGCNIEEKWKPLVKFFYYIGISKEGMRRILIARPIVFCIDLQNTIVPKVQFLREIGVQEDAIGDVLARFPRIFTYSLEKKIRPTVIFLLTKAGVSQRNVGKVIAFQPELLGCSIAHKLDPNVKFFLSLGIPLRKLGEMIADYPLILRYDIEKHLRPKYKYLRRTMVRPLEDLIEFPRFFSYSLEDRIIPRHKVLVENRVNFKLRYMLKSTDEKFEEMVQDKVERRRIYESGISCDKPSATCINDSVEDFSFNHQSNCSSRLETDQEN
ncbi:transcription termination factor MTERF2, chloroplastic-like [Ipomoea triloba]|uniref:transcription termination factor MTERF2, chloroplastic-like n=1 Tax=Ipomoea triloba TaxID=35885 RepID=UPI00125DB20C|nr:transcription termination factor MTERF2, chloroplastic-like [Ipomoea triloba]